MTRPNRKVYKRRARQAPAEDVAKEQAPSEEVGGNLPETEGGGRFRANNRLAARILSLGIVPPERAQTLVKNAYSLSEKSFGEGHTRNFASAARVVLSAAKVEGDTYKNALLAQNLMGQEFWRQLQEEGQEENPDQVVAAAFFEPTSPEEMGESLKFLNDFTTGTDNSSNFIFIDNDFFDSRCKRFQIFSRSSQCFTHFIQYMESAFFSLIERFFHLFVS